MNIQGEPAVFSRPRKHGRDLDKAVLENKVVRGGGRDQYGAYRRTIVRQR
jgi:hypothetical protein